MLDIHCFSLLILMTISYLDNHYLLKQTSLSHLIWPLLPDNYLLSQFKTFHWLWLDPDYSEHRIIFWIFLALTRTLNKNNPESNYCCIILESIEITGTLKRNGSLTLSWRRPLSYRNKSTDLLFKSRDWFLHDRDLRHERVKSW